MSYWEERSFELTKEIFQDSEDYVKFVHKEYQTSMNVLNNELSKHMNAIMKEQGMSIEEARKAIKEYEVEGLKSFVQKAKGTFTPEIEKELSFASRHARISRIQAMELEIKAAVSSLMDTEEKGLFAHLSNTFEKKYYHELYNLGRVTGYEHMFGINRDELRNIILHPWAPDGSDFSQRIWGRGDKLVDSLRRTLTQNIMRGRSPDEAIADISKTMNVSRAAAGRLVMTESAAINSKATQETYIRMRIKKYEIVATLDLSTSEICQGLDSKVFDTEHYAVGVTAPPFHPNCRSTTIPFFDDDIQKKLETSRIARNPETGKNERIENLSYKQWREKYVTNYEDKQEYENILKTLQEKTPAFDVFKDMKYNNLIEYESLMKDHSVIKAIHKNTSILEENQERAISLYYQFKENGVYASDHFVEQYIRREFKKSGVKNFEFEDILEIAKKPANYVDTSTGRLVKYYDEIALIAEDDKYVTIIKRKKVSGKWQRLK